MKKFPILAGMGLGAIFGLLTSIPDSLGLKIVMMSIGGLAGIAIGGAISRMLSKGPSLPLRKDAGSSIGFTPEERMSTYWLDKGEIYPMPGHPDPEGVTRDLDNLP